jgi:AraC-like DNA-binding protein
MHGGGVDMKDVNQVYFQKTHLDTIIEINDIVVMRYYEFQSDVSFNDFEVHNFWEFVYVDKGSIRAYADDEYFDLEQGEMIFHKPGQSHDLFGNGKAAANVLVGCFFCENKAMEYFEDKIVTVNKKNKELLSSIIMETKEAFEEQTKDVYMLEMIKRKDCLIGSQQMVKMHLEELLIRLIREDNFQRKYERSQSVTRDNFETELVDKIIDYMKTNIGDNLKREDLCSKFNISITSMEMVFKKVTSQTTMKYFSNLKIETAKKMIRESTYNFTQISEILGFSTPHYFSAVFKRAVKMTPSEYANSIKAIADTGDV